MRILVLGASGMLGHKIFRQLYPVFPGVIGTIRGPLKGPLTDVFGGGEIIDNLDVMEFGRVRELLLARRPDVVVNCVGIVKQRREAQSAVPSITINALLPHRLAELCEQWGGKVIHFSTDCVFKGTRGRYTESDCVDADDLYGKSKALGEVQRPNALTLRTSIIGRELEHFQGLLEWFLSQNHGTINGYRKALYSGVTTNYLAGVVASLLAKGLALNGLYQVTSQTISKYDLLQLLRDAYALDITIIPSDDIACDRSMTGEKFEEATGFRCPSWAELILQLANDKTPYTQWRTRDYEGIRK